MKVRNDTLSFRGFISITRGPHALTGNGAAAPFWGTLHYEPIGATERRLFSLHPGRRERKDAQIQKRLCVPKTRFTRIRVGFACWASLPNTCVYRKLDSPRYGSDFRVGHRFRTPHLPDSGSLSSMGRAGIVTLTQLVFDGVPEVASADARYFL